jgi:hypothetical protein
MGNQAAFFIRAVLFVPVHSYSGRSIAVQHIGPAKLSFDRLDPVDAVYSRRSLALITADHPPFSSGTIATGTVGGQSPMVFNICSNLYVRSAFEIKVLDTSELLGSPATAVWQCQPALRVPKGTITANINLRLWIGRRRPSYVQAASGDNARLLANAASWFDVNALIRSCVFLLPASLLHEEPP